MMANAAALKGEVPWCTSGYYLEHRPLFTLDPAFHAGAYYVQEASSMFLEYLLNTVLGEKRDLLALDLCAAPGGKTTLLAAMPQFRMVLANEIIRSRVSILYENTVKWGDPKVFISNDDPVRFSQLPGHFDVMVVDAPCSGSGLFRKDKAALEEWSQANVALCADRQKRILADALPALKEGGVLVYSTCSYSPEEDEDILDWLMSHARLEPVDLHLPETWGIVRTESASGGTGFRFFPGKAEGEGFFIACFRLSETVAAGAGNQRKRAAFRAGAVVPDTWLDPTAEVVTIEAAESIYCIPAHLQEDELRLREVLNIRRSGVKAGSRAQADFVPDHELILSNYLALAAPAWNMDKDAALQYLRKGTIIPKEVEKGWYVAKYMDLPLGLLKHLGNRVNNYYPASWRILMS